ncbi:MAG: DNA polymerase III subunit gamma/tau [Deltaproteobacteria bacterium]|nr:DNA polymerase III subunit gamma/tau [Candidatus Zymogenaceae bacterium]
MSYLVIARKYRPQSFEDVIGQNHVTRTLSNAITSGRIAHAYLFTGPRGVGKTTVARILAKALNCVEGPTPTPCNRCPQCVGITEGSVTDVYEIDGASNTGVDDIRDLRERVRYLPQAGRYNIYIIDEVHMLSTNAFNALLKILEEPPGHVIFIFATTEPHKIPMTVLSRTQRFDYKRIAVSEIVRHLQNISEAEGIAVTPAALLIIAREAQGSMRDAQSLLDQIIGFAGTNVTEQDAREVLGLSDRALIYRMADALTRRDTTAALDILADVYGQGYDIVHYYRELVEVFRHILLGRVVENPPMGSFTDEEKSEILEMGRRVDAEILTVMFDILFNAEQSITQSTDPLIALELSLIKITRAGDIRSITDIISEMQSMDIKGADASITGGGPGPGGERKKKDLSDPRPSPQEAPTARPEQYPEDKPRPRSDQPGDAAGFLSFLENKDPRMHSMITQQGTVLLEGDRLVVRMPRKSSFIDLDEPERAEKLRDELSRYFRRPMDFTIETVDASESGESPISEEGRGETTAGAPAKGTNDNRQKLIDSDTARHIFEVFEDVDVEGYTPGKK